MSHDAVELRDVTARDGLQGEVPLTVAQRVTLIEALLAAGVRHLEIAAFVSSTAVPAMAGAAEVVAAVGVRPGVCRTALVPNVRGAQAALLAGVDELTVTMSASATYNERNVRMSIDQSVDQVEAICSLAGTVPVDAVISCAFGSPYEGDVAAADVAAMADRLRAGGVAAITLADTTGMATPRRIDEALASVDGPVGMHLHETRGTGLVNAYAAWQAGVRRFDCSVGGLGGSPFAAGAAGNVATEELVALFDDLGVPTGLDVQGLIDAALLAEQLIGRPVPSRVAHVGPRDRRAPSS